MKHLTLSDEDYKEVIDGLQVMQHDRCGSPEERQQVQDVIDRVKLNTHEATTLVSRPLDHDFRRRLDEIDPEPSRLVVVDSPFTFSDVAGIKAIEWFANVSIEDREAFLHAVGAYAVSETTWYVHPEEVESDHLGTIP